VEKNAGAAGIDRMTVEAFREREETLLREIQEKLKAGIYRFQPDVSGRLHEPSS